MACTFTSVSLLPTVRVLAAMVRFARDEALSHSRLGLYKGSITASFVRDQWLSFYLFFPSKFRTGPLVSRA
ncbi:hypothetical protein BDU57DRAFT_234049 [Ampelomyces quisqualis]|uniref:Secreted protein n=1 Tax=Ampelomyces quisqualis TaxID=50730 RepID=A0A6A5QPN1_AMPQU|nr:hypothetical protein BDU57DRAFT_234049 [Ampelomyces quisqualis]